MMPPLDAAGQMLMLPPQPEPEPPPPEPPPPEPARRQKVLSRRESEQSVARLYSGGGRKGFAAQHERSMITRVYAAVDALYVATAAKPCDTDAVARAIGRTDHSMRAVICALFERELGQTPVRRSIGWGSRTARWCSAGWSVQRSGHRRQDGRR